MTDCCTPPAATPRYRIAGSPRPQADAVLSKIHILQMDCPVEEGLIRKKLGSMSGVGSLQFNLLQRVLTVSHSADALPAVMAAISELGFTPALQDGSTAAAAPEPVKPWWPLALAGVLALGSEISHWLAMPEGLTAVLALIAVLACGLTTYKKGWIAVRNGELNINALMSIAVTGALVIGQWPEAAMVMVLFTLAELIEAKSLGRARNAIGGLLQLTPEQATVRQADGSWLDLPAAGIALGSILRVKPGERIALDGMVTSGQSFVNQAAITGESLPVEKNSGDMVFASTINEAGSFEYRVTAVAGNTMLARIIHAVEAAQGVRAPTQRFVDRFAKIYTPLVCLLALGVAVIPPLLGGGWLDWIYRALAMLVIACPCALVISTPVTIVSGLARAARQGILIKGGIYLEEGRKLKSLALDKTGTLTMGKPRQTDAQSRAGLPLADMQQIAASLGSRSDHPVSRAIAAECATYSEVSDFTALPGRGVSGRIAGTQYFMGNHRLIEDLGLCSPELEDALQALETQGKSVVILAADKVLALFAVADTLRPGSREAIAQLRALGVETVILSGDNASTVTAIGAELGIDRAHGNLLPEDKLQMLQAMPPFAGMVGDGINDAPALASAHIGFAMGVAGTDTAIETADVALMDDDLRKIPEFIRLSQATHRILLQNITLALLVKLVFLLLTLAGYGSLWMAVFADMGVSLLVVFNGLRLLRK